MADFALTKNMTLYDACAVQSQGNERLVLQCMTNYFADRLEHIHSNALDTSMSSWLLVLFGSGVFFMQAGFATLCAGAVRKKNVVNTLLKNLLDACGAALAFYATGYGLAYGNQETSSGTTFAGNGQFFGYQVSDFAFWFFQYAFSAATVTIVAGTLAERSKMTAYFVYSLLLSGFVYPIVAHNIWSSRGFLSPFNDDPMGGVGFIDAAGSGVVHLCGGVTALVATSILGPRQGRFYDEDGNAYDEPKPIHGHSMALQLLGTLILWFGWFSFNAGSALLLPSDSDAGSVGALAAVNTTIAGGSGAITALIYWALTTGRKGLLAFDLSHAMNGALAGLVSVTAGCFTLDIWAAAVTGAVAGMLYIKGSRWLERFRIDDAVNAVPVHMFGGLWGVLATGLFSDPKLVEKAFGIADRGGFFFEVGKTTGGFNISLLGNQCVGILFIVGWTVATTGPFFLWLRWMGWLRVERLVEIGGLDAAYHAEERDKLAEAELRMALDTSRHKNTITVDNTEQKKHGANQDLSSSHRPKVVNFTV